MTIDAGRVVSHCSGDFWKTWLPYSQFKQEFPNLEPNYWLIAPSMLILETDFPERQDNKEFADRISEKLDTQKVSYNYYWTGNKSYHIEVEFLELAEWNDAVRPKFKEALAKHLLNPVLMQAIDDANFRTKRMIAIPNTPHRKTGICKRLVKTKDYGINKLPEKIREHWERYSGEWQPPEIIFPSQQQGLPSKCPFIEFACTHAFDKKVGRNLHLVPNVVAFTQDRNIWQACADIQGKNIREFENWALRKPDFSCLQLQKFARKLGFTACALCNEKQKLLSEKTREELRLVRKTRWQ